MLSSFNNITVISNNNKLINQIRKTSTDILQNNYTENTYLRDTPRNKLCIVDQQCTNYPRYNDYTADYSVHIIHDKTYANIKRTYESGCDCIIYSPPNMDHIKYLIEEHCLNNKHIKEYHGIHLDYNKHSILYENALIKLTKREFSFLQELLTTNKHASFSDKYAQVLVHRINYKTRKATGLSFIKSDYGLGYTISI